MSVALDRPVGEQPPIPVRISESQHLTGQCPNCGWTPPVQNAFRPNIFHEYVDEKGRVSILSNADDIVQVKNEDGDVTKTYARQKNDKGFVIRRTSIEQSLQQQQIPQISQSIVSGNAIPLPAQLLKSPEELKSAAPVKIASPDLPSTVGRGDVAPTQMPPSTAQVSVPKP